MIEGLQLAYADDDALLAQGMTLFDSLYRSFERSARVRTATASLQALGERLGEETGRGSSEGGH